MENIQRLLQDVSNQTLVELLHSCVDDICEKKRVYHYDYFKSCTNWSKEEYDILHSYFKTLIFDLVDDSVPEQKIMEESPGLSSAHVQYVLDCLTVRKTEIENLLLRRSFSVSGAKVQDFDWKLKWIVGSSSLSSVREPLLLLDLNLYEDAGDGKNVSLELNRNELKMLLSSLEKAQENIKSLKN